MSALSNTLDVIKASITEKDRGNMQTQKTFIKKTRRGNIIKVVREHYLRDDIWCGSPLCQLCEQEPENCILDKKPISKSRLASVSNSFVV